MLGGRPVPADPRGVVAPGGRRGLAGPGALRQPGHRVEPAARPGAPLAADVRHPDARRRPPRCWQQLGIPLPDTTRSVRSLSGGQRQLVAMAGRWPASPGCCCWTSPPRRWASADRPGGGADRRGCANAGTTIVLACHDIDQMFRLADRIVVLRQGRVVADVIPAQVHPDDVVTLLSGQQVDSSARRQLTRLHGLADRLVSADPSSSLSLILSALGAALGSERLCIHLLAGDSLVCAASLGLPDALLSAWSRLPIGPAAARSGWRRPTERPVVPTTSGPALPGRRSATWPGRPRWPAPGRCRSGPGRAGRGDHRLPRRHRAAAARRAGPGHPLRRVRGERHRARPAAGRGHHAQPGARDDQGDAGDAGRADPGGQGTRPSRCSRCAAGLQADEVALVTRAPARARPACRAHVAAAGADGPARRGRLDAAGRRAGAARHRDDVACPRLPATGQRCLAVTFAAPARAHGAAGRLAERTADRGRHRAAGGRRALTAAGAGARGGRARAPGGGGPAPVAGTAARFPVPAEPRAAHPADRDPGVRLQPDAAGRDLGRASPSSASWTGSRPSRPASGAWSTTCSTSPPSSRASCGCSGTGVTSRWCSRRRSPACRRPAPPWSR